MKNPATVNLSATNAGHMILNKVVANYTGTVAIRLWDGKLVKSQPDATCTIVIKHPGVLRELILYRNVVHLAENYLIQNIDINGDIESVFDLLSYFSELIIPWSTKFTILRLALKLPTFQRDSVVRSKPVVSSRENNSKKSIAHHYDVGNDFYKLWLDKNMVYSCAYFSNKSQTLENAQHDKLDYLCKKLRLSENQTLLDIGCGWGALICWAAKNYGVKAHGITLSEQQFTYVQELIRKEGLQDNVSVELRNYVDLPTTDFYDRIVSVGMFEHIGINNFPVYFNTIKRLLTPGGLFLNHGITIENGWNDTAITRFINQYVFPDGELARINTVVNAMENAGFEIIDVEGLRRHYALTLRHWIKALEENVKTATALIGEASYRVWRLYMSGSAYHFDDGNINVYQVLVGHVRNPLKVGLRRDELYENGCECV